MVKARFRTVARWPRYLLSFSLSEVPAGNNAPASRPKHLKGSVHGTLRVGTTTPSGGALGSHQIWFGDNANRGVLSVIQRSSGSSRARFAGTVAGGPIHDPGVTLGTINGTLVLIGGRPAGKHGVADSTSLDVGLNVASALAYESFIGDSTRTTVPSGRRKHGEVFVNGGTTTFFMEEGSNADGSGSTTALSATAIDAILANDDSELPAAHGGKRTP
jgi:hypothetical protein